MSTPPTFSDAEEAFDAAYAEIQASRAKATKLFNAADALCEFAVTNNLQTFQELEAALFRGISCHPEVPDSIRQLQESLKEALG